MWVKCVLVWYSQPLTSIFGLVNSNIKKMRLECCLHPSHSMVSTLIIICIWNIWRRLFTPKVAKNMNKENYFITADRHCVNVGRLISEEKSHMLKNKLRVHTIDISKSYLPVSTILDNVKWNVLFYIQSTKLQGDHKRKQSKALLHSQNMQFGGHY